MAESEVFPRQENTSRNVGFGSYHRDLDNEVYIK